MRAATIASFGVVIVIAGCGGGGGSSSSSGPPNPLYVDAAKGSDTNAGDLAHPLASVVKAAQIAQSGYTIVVAPGNYSGGIMTPTTGKPPQGMRFVADTSGAQTSNSPGPVVIDGTGLEAGFKLTNSDGTVIDGFTVIGNNSGNFGIEIKSSSDKFVVQNCIIHDNGDDGIHVQDSANVLIFNNLVYRNSGHGIAIAGNGPGSPNARVVNNTVYNNTGNGLQFGTSQVPSPGGFVRNNIIEKSGAQNVKVFTNPRSDVSYDEDFDLVFPTTFDTGNPPIEGQNDITGKDANFVSTTAADFHLASNSPAINAGDALDPSVTAQLRGYPDLRSALMVRTAIGGTPDNDGDLDLGYHYPM